MERTAQRTGGRLTASVVAGAAIGGRLRNLFGVALDRMKKLPPEPIKVSAIVPVAQVRRG